MAATCKYCEAEWMICCGHRCFCGETQEEDGFYWDEYNKRINLPNDVNLLQEYKENTMQKFDDITDDNTDKEDYTETDLILINLHKSVERMVHVRIRMETHAKNFLGPCTEPANEKMDTPDGSGKVFAINEILRNISCNLKYMEEAMMRIERI